MVARISAEQREAMEVSADQPLEIVDELRQKKYVLIEESSLRQLENLANPEALESESRLADLIQKGLDSPVIEAEKVYAHLRAKAAAVMGKSKE